MHCYHYPFIPSSSPHFLTDMTSYRLVLVYSPILHWRGESIAYYYDMYINPLTHSLTNLPGLNSIIIVTIVHTELHSFIHSMKNKKKQKKREKTTYTSFPSSLSFVCFFLYFFPSCIIPSYRYRYPTSKAPPPPPPPPPPPQPPYITHHKQRCNHGEITTVRRQMQSIAYSRHECCGGAYCKSTTTPVPARAYSHTIQHWSSSLVHYFIFRLWISGGGGGLFLKFLFPIVVIISQL